MDHNRAAGYLLSILLAVAFMMAAITVTVTRAKGQLGPEYMARPHEVLIVDTKQEKVYRNPQAVYEDRDSCENAIDGVGAWLDEVAKLDPKLLENVKIPYPERAEPRLLMAVADLVVNLLQRDGAMPKLAATCAPIGKRA